MTINKVAIYCRVSTDEQAEAKTINNQVEFAQKYCDLHEISIQDFYMDDGVSGTIALEDRPEGKRLLDDANSRQFSRVLIYRLDRLGRDPRLILNAIDQLEKTGVQVISMTEPFDTSSPTGRFLLTILSGVAGLERDTIVERSIAGTNRLAREGAWLGGIVPYGYKVEGKSREARLVISDELLDGHSISESDVIRLIYKLTVEDHMSCQKICDHLNMMHIPSAYIRDKRQILRGKRKQSTSGIWRPARLRNMIVNTTYKGIHYYGKRSKKQRDVIERTVPAIVSEETWNRAQTVLSEHMLFSPRGAKNQYLLRGLIKCGVCGHTYSGFQKSDKYRQNYYRCIGKISSHEINGINGIKCTNKNIRGDIEDIVWQDIEGYLRNPEDILKELAAKSENRAEDNDEIQKELNQIELAIRGKQNEHDRVISLYRRGIIDESSVDRQLEAIQTEEKMLTDEKNKLVAQINRADSNTNDLDAVERLLQGLGNRLDESLPFEKKREIVEAFVKNIRVDSVEHDGIQDIDLHITYKFSSTATRTDKDSY
ncbi:MAG: recombinase family protein [Armatimonadota bacterium]